MPRLETTARRAWNLLPPRVTSSRAADSAKGLVRPWLRGTPPPPQRVVHTLDELDEMLEYLDERASVSDDALRRGFQSFRMELTPTMPADPYSEGYRLAVMELYEWLHGSPYELKNENSDFEFERFVNVPFPYSTQSGSTVGNHLIAIGHVIRTLDLAPRSRVLELGPGWGNTTIALAQMGHTVTAIDISKEFVDLIQARAQRVHTPINALVGDFSAIREIDGTFDAVLFFESFHHSTHHLDLLASLEKTVAPGGRVLFAAEPIEDEYYLPWGPRLDGESLWAIRTKGWFELGFRRSYFLEALRRAGWWAQQVDCPEQPAASILVARRFSDARRVASS
jgi:2-polyprenyl-3-methyl-5-hydroxy-6-metoxy-1,4-benzoquinol methylase